MDVCLVCALLPGSGDVVLRGHVLAGLQCAAFAFIVLSKFSKTRFCMLCLGSSWFLVWSCAKLLTELSITEQHGEVSYDVDIAMGRCRTTLMLRWGGVVRR